MKILGYPYTVQFVGADSMDGAMGRFYARQQRIEIASNMAPDGQLSTMLHEVLEALNYHLALNLPHAKIMALEAGLYQVLSENGVDLGPLLEGK